MVILQHKALISHFIDERNCKIPTLPIKPTMVRSIWGSKVVLTGRRKWRRLATYYCCCCYWNIHFGIISKKPGLRARLIFFPHSEPTFVAWPKKSHQSWGQWSIFKNDIKLQQWCALHLQSESKIDTIIMYFFSCWNTYITILLLLLMMLFSTDNLPYQCALKLGHRNRFHIVAINTYIDEIFWRIDDNCSFSKKRNKNSCKNANRPSWKIELPIHLPGTEMMMTMAAV